MTRWFLPDVPDLIGLLTRQSDVTAIGLAAFARWAAGDDDAADEVRGAEHDADDAKRAVRQALRQAFTTPLDPEDLYELSERLDAVINQAKNVVREAEVLGVTPDRRVAAMAGAVVEGHRHLHVALCSLRSDAATATDASDAAVRAVRGIEWVYREAMSELLAGDDLREVMGRREIYRRCARLADAVEAVAERVWYASVKEP